MGDKIVVQVDISKGVIHNSMLFPFMRSMFTKYVPGEPLFLRGNAQFLTTYPTISSVLCSQYWHWNLGYMEHRQGLFDKSLADQYITVEFRVPPMGDELLAVFTEPGKLKYSFWTSFHKDDMHMTGEFHERPARDYRDLECYYVAEQRRVGAIDNRKS